MYKILYKNLNLRAKFEKTGNLSESFNELKKPYLNTKTR